MPKQPLRESGTHRWRVRLGQALPWTALAVLVGFLGISRLRFEEVHAEFSAYRDRVSTGLRKELISRDSALHVGELVPGMMVRARSGEILLLSDLPRLGYRYLYFHREDCSVCQSLAPVWKSLAPSTADSVAFIAYRQGHDLEPALLYVNSFAIQAKSQERTYPLMKYVPSLLTVREDGYVTAIGDGLPDMTRLLHLYRLLPEDVIVANSTVAFPDSASRP